MNLYLVGAFSDASAAHDVGRSISGRVIADPRDDTSHLPFAAIAWGTTDDLSAFEAKADAGIYLIAERVIKPRSDEGPGELPGIIALFPMIGSPALGHALSDAHWRDNHAPLALDVHIHMRNYRQLSVLRTLAGMDLNGLALCGMDSADDARNRFFKDEEGRKAIANDVSIFADTAHSPRRLLGVETVYG